MAKIKIVTDSTADLPKGLAEQLEITVVPLKVHFGEEEYLDWVDLSSEAFYEKLKSSEIMPRTSQPSPADFEAIFKDLSQDGSTIISIHISSHLSGTYQSAIIAKSMLEDVDVEVVDSRNTSMALGIVVLEAARAAKAGKSKEEILSQVYDDIGRVRVYFGVETLEYLHKNGRIGKAAALLGGLLSVKPLLTLQDGIIVPKEKVRGRAKLMERLASLYKEEYGADLKGKMVIMHGDAPQEAQKLKERLEKEYKNVSEILVTPLGSVVGTHTGPGVLALTLLPEGGC